MSQTEEHKQANDTNAENVSITTRTTITTGTTHHTGQTNILETFHLGWVPRWTAILGLLSIGVLYALLPEKLIVGPNWLLLVIELVLLLPVCLSWVTGQWLSYKAIRILSMTVLGLATLGLAIGIFLLITSLSTIKQPTLLLRSAGLLWTTNIVIFGLWYWELDGGGPRERHLAHHEAVDFMFPQQVNGNTTQWMPFFFDYLYLAFNTATAFSPTDTYPLTRRAKALMMLQSSLSLLIVAILIGRVANIF
jgi:hypothetical protein